MNATLRDCQISELFQIISPSSTACDGSCIAWPSSFAGTGPRANAVEHMLKESSSREQDVPGRKPNVAERVGVSEDYILTSAVQSHSRARAPIRVEFLTALSDLPPLEMFINVLTTAHFIGEGMTIRVRPKASSR